MSDNLDTPSAKIIKKSNEIKQTKDSEGRVISYKNLKPSDQLEMVSLIGTERAINPITVSMCSATFRAVSIDGIILFEPTTYEELKNNMDLLDDHGLSALYDAFRGKPNLEVVGEKKEDPQAEVKDIKGKK